MRYSLLKNGIIFDSAGIEHEQKGCTVITPPRNVTTSLYRCDKQFIVDPLLPLFAPRLKYGVVEVGGEVTTLYEIHGCDISKVATVTSNIRNKHKRGGQSQNRFQRLRVIQIGSYISTIVEEIETCFRAADIQIIVLTGCIDKRLLVEKALPGQLKEKTETSTQTVNIIAGTYCIETRIEEREIAQFYQALTVDMAVYGIKETQDALELGQLSTVLVPIPISGPGTGACELQTWKEQAARVGTRLVFVDSSKISSALIEKYCREFGGFGGILRYTQ